MRTVSAQLKSPWQVRTVEVDLPDSPPAGHVLVRVEACGICGSDLTAAQTVADWKPFGHEIAGVIEAVGPGVTSVAPGARVALESGSFCGVCDLCRDGRADLCHKAPNFWQQPALGFSRHMHAPACCCVRYEGLPADIAALAEPAGVALDLVKTAGITLGDRVAVVGPGPLGLMAVALARHSGAAEVACIGRPQHQRRLAVAAELGAQPLVAAQPLDQVAALRDRFDHVLMTAPARHLPECFPLLRFGGEVTYIGFGVGSGQIAFDANAFHLRKLQLRASFAHPAMYYPAVLRLLRAGVLPAARLISHRLPLSRIAEALHLHRDHKDETVKVIVTPD